MLIDRSKLGGLDESRMHIHDTRMTLCVLSTNMVTGAKNSKHSYWTKMNGNGGSSLGAMPLSFRILTFIQNKGIMYLQHDLAVSFRNINPKVIITFKLSFGDQNES